MVSTFYKKDGDTLRFRKIVRRNSRLLCLSGTLLEEKAIIHQSFTYNSAVELGMDSLTSLLLSQGFDYPEGEETEMFIQIVPDSAMSTFQFFKFMNLRQNLEDEVDEKLKESNLGKWSGGDMGAGANMLFTIRDWDNAMKVVTKVLHEEGLLNHVLIARRIMLSHDNWTYDVVYPVEYQGIFNPM